jgi:hypothetical protein
MLLRLLITPLLALTATAALAPSKARADTNDVPTAATAPLAPAHDDGDARVGATWSLEFLGSLLTPTAELAHTHRSSLGSGLRLGVVGSGGVGLQLGMVYSPLPANKAMGSSDASHFGMLTLAPRVAGTVGPFRLWAAGGGAGIAQRSTTGPDAARTAKLARAAGGYAATGLELHLFDGGGIATSASYVHTVRGAAYTLYELTAGVVFLF